MGFAEGQESKVQMKTISLLILVTVFILGTMTKDFLITLEKQKGSHADSDIDGQDIEEEKVNKADVVAKETEMKGIGLDIIGDKTSHVHRVSSDYDLSLVQIGQGIFLDSGGTLWECRFRKSKR